MLARMPVTSVNRRRGDAVRVENLLQSQHQILMFYGILWVLLIIQTVKHPRGSSAEVGKDLVPLLLIECYILLYDRTAYYTPVPSGSLDCGDRFSLSRSISIQLHCPCVSYSFSTTSLSPSFTRIRHPLGTYEWIAATSCR